MNLSAHTFVLCGYDAAALVGRGAVRIHQAAQQFPSLIYGCLKVGVRDVLVFQEPQHPQFCLNLGQADPVEFCAPSFDGIKHTRNFPKLGKMLNIFVPDAQHG